jgi:hypothetical protein
MDWLGVGVAQRIGYSKREAKEMLAGFAFGVAPLTWKLPVDYFGRSAVVRERTEPQPSQFVTERVIGDRCFRRCPRLCSNYVVRGIAKVPLHGRERSAKSR